MNFKDTLKLNKLSITTARVKNELNKFIKLTRIEVRDKGGKFIINDLFQNQVNYSKFINDDFVYINIYQEKVLKFNPAFSQSALS